MRHLMILLLCVGTCLAATAGKHDLMKQFMPVINYDQSPSKQRVMAPNRMNVHFTAGDNNPSGNDFMSGAKKSLQSKKLNKENLVNKRAPRRLSSEDIIGGDYVCFLYKCWYNDDYSDYVAADPYYAGMGAYWYPEVYQGTTYFAGLYWTDEGTYYLPIDIDFETGEVALPWGILFEDDTISSAPGARNRTDTIRYSVLCSEDFFLNGEENDCMGTLYADGSIIFDDNYVYYSETITNVYRNYQLTSSETTYHEDVYVGTEILAANGELTFKKEQNNSVESCPVFMYQEGENVYVGNLWDYGVPDAMFVLSADNTFNYPCAYEVDGNTYLYNPIWDIDDSWISGGLGEFYPVSDYTMDDEGYIDSIVWGISGVAVPEQLSWDFTMPCNGYHFLYGFENNVLRWTNGNQFIIPTVHVILRGDANDDGVVDLYDIVDLNDALLTENFDDVEGAFNGDNADCNQDGSINIADVAALIEYVTNGNWPD